MDGIRLFAKTTQCQPYRYTLCLNDALFVGRCAMAGYLAAMNSLPQTFFRLPAIAALAMATHTSSAALIAEWNFSTGTSADLTSDVGGYTFTPTGNAPVYSAGSITLDQYTGLFAGGVNSTALPVLTETATIYLNLRLDTSVAATAGFYFGFLNATSAADWAQMTLTGWTYDGVHTGGYFATDNPLVLGGEASGFFPATGEYYAIALTATAGVDAFGNPDPTKTRIQTYINGTLSNTLALPIDNTNGPAGELNAFQSFAIGQLKASGGIAGFTFDHIQIYDTVLTAAEIAAIPEPGTAVLFGLGGIFLGFARRRRATVN